MSPVFKQNLKRSEGRAKLFGFLISTHLTILNTQRCDAFQTILIELNFNTIAILNSIAITSRKNSIRAIEIVHWQQGQSGVRRFLEYSGILYAMHWITPVDIYGVRRNQICKLNVKLVNHQPSWAFKVPFDRATIVLATLPHNTLARETKTAGFIISS